MCRDALVKGPSQPDLRRNLWRSAEPCVAADKSSECCGTGVTGLFDCSAIPAFPQKNKEGDKSKLPKVDLTLWLLSVMFGDRFRFSDVSGRKSIFYFFLYSNTMVCFPLPFAPMSTSTSCCKTRPLVIEIHTLPSAIPKCDFMTVAVNAGRFSAQSFLAEQLA